MSAPWILDYTPHPKQKVLHACRATQILYGGAAGGAKSHGIRMDGIIACLQNPGCQAYLFRRTVDELRDNHINKILAMGIPASVGEYRETRKVFEFTNGSAMNFCYAERDEDIRKHQGAEMHWAGIDEAALMTPFQLRYIRTRVRLGGWKPQQEGWFPRLIFASNPGGPSHQFLKSTFIQPAAPMSYFGDKSTATPNSPEGWTSIYIPSRMEDNPSLDRDQYEGAFTSLAPELARALRDGDWDAVVGAALHNLSRERHQIRAFTPPKHWTHFSSIDWGTYMPFHIGWYCVSEGATLEAKDGYPEVWLPPGAIVMFDEWYGWNGSANEGMRMESPQVARRWLALEEERKMPPMDFRMGDSQMWAQMDGPSVNRRMHEATEGRVNLRQGRRDRRANYAEFIARLGGEADAQGDINPMFFITANCQHAWRTLPGLMLDKTEPDKGPATRDQEDHVYDSICFALSSQPYVTTQKDRDDIAYRDFVRRHEQNAVPYARA